MCHSILVSQLTRVCIEIKWHRFLCLKFVGRQITSAILTVWLLSKLLSCVWSSHGHILLRVLYSFGAIVFPPPATPSEVPLGMPYAQASLYTVGTLGTVTYVTFHTTWRTPNRVRNTYGHWGIMLHVRGYFHIGINSLDCCEYGWGVR